LVDKRKETANPPYQRKIGVQAKKKKGAGVKSENKVEKEAKKVKQAKKAPVEEKEEEDEAVEEEEKEEEEEQKEQKEKKKTVGAAKAKPTDVVAVVTDENFSELITNSKYHVFLKVQSTL
jgi:hypothetical protein